MQTDNYKGITSTFTSEYKSSGSKFYGYLFPVQDVNDFERKIKEWKEEFSDATHVCSACVIGLERDYQRCSDDGEPSNSAGRPILNNLLSAEMTFVGCAVVRYYGGKKLGIPGLIEAYGGAAALCIEQAEVKNIILQGSIICSISPAQSYLLYNYLNKHKELSYVTLPDGKFKITHPQSMTAELQQDLKKIDTLVVI